jgi:hypothetical protein
MFTRNKHSCLLIKFVNYDRKKFLLIGPSKKKFSAVKRTSFFPTSVKFQCKQVLYCQSRLCSRRRRRRRRREETSRSTCPRRSCRKCQKSFFLRRQTLGKLECFQPGPIFGEKLGQRTPTLR